MQANTAPLDSDAGKGHELIILHSGDWLVYMLWDSEDKVLCNTYEDRMAAKENISIKACNLMPLLEKAFGIERKLHKVYESV